MSTSPASTTSKTTIVPASSAEASSLEGLERVEIRQFVGIADMQKIVQERSKELEAGASNQYLIFQPVTSDDLVEIDRERASIGKHSRMTHYTDTHLLIVKLMPSATHEGAHVNFANNVLVKVVRMGVSVNEFFGLGAARFSGPNSSKEGDSSFKPSSRTNEDDWPTIVFESELSESGLSESLRRLRSDARWWLNNSQGDVKIVILISVKPAQRKIDFEKWEFSPVPGRRPSTRAFPNNPLAPQNQLQIPTRIQAITINHQNTVTGAPLVLRFQKIFLRPAVPPEADIVFTAQELSGWAANLWTCLGR
jgi:hypothetical protein